MLELTNHHEPRPESLELPGDSDKLPRDPDDSRESPPGFHLRNQK